MDNRAVSRRVDLYQLRAGRGLSAQRGFRRHPDLRFLVSSADRRRADRAGQNAGSQSVAVFWPVLQPETPARRLVHRLLPVEFLVQSVCLRPFADDHQRARRRSRRHPDFGRQRDAGSDLCFRPVERQDRGANAGDDLFLFFRGYGVHYRLYRRRLAADQRRPAVAGQRCGRRAGCRRRGCLLSRGAPA